MTGGEVFPECFGVGGVGEPAGQTDDCDIGGGFAYFRFRRDFRHKQTRRVFDGDVRGHSSQIRVVE